MLISKGRNAILEVNKSSSTVESKMIINVDLSSNNSIKAKFSLFSLFKLLAVPHSLQDLSVLTRDWTHTFLSESVES